MKLSFLSTLCGLLLILIAACNNEEVSNPNTEFSAESTKVEGAFTAKGNLDSTITAKEATYYISSPISDMIDEVANMEFVAKELEAVEAGETNEMEAKELK